MNPRRRALLLTSLSLTAGQWPIAVRAQAGTPPFSLDEFLTLSARLSGRKVASLDRKIAGTIFDVLSQQGRLAELAGLLDNESSHPELAGEVLAAWYCGWLPGPSSTTVIGFPQALIWSSAPFLHPPGVCGGAVGYWAEPPLT